MWDTGGNIRQSIVGGGDRIMNSTISLCWDIIEFGATADAHTIIVENAHNMLTNHRPPTYSTPLCNNGIIIPYHMVCMTRTS